MLCYEFSCKLHNLLLFSWSGLYSFFLGLEFHLTLEIVDHTKRFTVIVQVADGNKILEERLVQWTLLHHWSLQLLAILFWCMLVCYNSIMDCVFGFIFPKSREPSLYLVMGGWTYVVLFIYCWAKSLVILVWIAFCYFSFISRVVLEVWIMLFFYLDSNTKKSDTSF